MEPKEPVEGLHVAVSVEKYYDRHCRSWCIRKMDKFGNQCGDAYYTGVKSDALSCQRTYEKEIADGKS